MRIQREYPTASILYREISHVSIIVVNIDIMDIFFGGDVVKLDGMRIL